MSFSYDVKEEISRHIAGARHCQIAELAGILVNVGEWQPDGSIFIQTEHEPVIRKIELLIKKIYNVDNVWAKRYYSESAGKTEQEPESFAKKETEHNHSQNHVVNSEQKPASHHMADANQKPDLSSVSQNYCITSKTLVEKITHTIKFDEMKEHRISQLLLKSTCCRRAYLQGSFLCIGSMSDPEKSYHLEYVCSTETQAIQLQELIRELDLEAKITKRKKYYIVYMKESESIVEMLGILGAHKALMEMENSRILKELRNSVNRVCNCDNANIKKTIRAAEKQSEDIKYLRDCYGLENLPPNLREMALVRLEYPDTPLKELGEYLDPPVGKSGVNHRLRKLSELAEEHRCGKVGTKSNV